MPVTTGKDVYIHPLAHVSGDVSLGDGVSLWPGASVRGDRSAIVIGKGSNVQDNATVHSEAAYPVTIGANVTVGHNAVVHGATVGDNTIVGMGAIILDGTVVGSGCIIGAGAVIGGRKNIPARSVVVGNPYRILREATDDDVARNAKNAEEYAEAAAKYKNGEI